jgi:hypothetical protein
MSYYVQAELTRGCTHHIGWFDCEDILMSSHVGWEVSSVYPGTILMDGKGVDGKDLRSITVSPDAVWYARNIRAMYPLEKEEKP